MPWAELGGVFTVPDVTMSSSEVATLLRTHKNVRQYTLVNGLRVALLPDRSVPLVGTYLRFAVGSRHEGPSRHGMAHLFEHLMFAGTRSVERGRHLQLVQSVGGNANATTSTDWTGFYHVVPPEALEMVLWLEAERLGGLPAATSKSNIQTEVAVVANERLFTVDNRPYGGAAELIAAAAFPPGHPYAHLPLGDPAHLAAVSTEDVLGFYARHYVPNRGVLAVTGDIDPAETSAMIDKYFGGIPEGTPSTGDPAPAVISGRVEVERTSPAAPRLFLGVFVPPTSSPEHDHCRVVASLLAGGPTGWLMRRLGHELGLVADVRIRLMAQAAGQALAIVELVPREGAGLSVVEEVYRTELTRLADTGVDGGDLLDRAAAMYTSQVLARLDRVGGTADELSLSWLLGDADRFARRFEPAGSLTPADAVAQIRRFSGAEGLVALRYLRDEER